MSITNNFHVLGRLTQNPSVFMNKDGSEKIRFTVAVKNNYKSRNNERDSQFIPVEVFRNAVLVVKSGLGVYANIHEGDLVACSGQIRNNNYTDKDGNKHFDIILQVDDIELLESKAVTDARLASKMTAAAAAAQNSSVPNETPVEVPIDVPDMLAPDDEAPFED